MPAAWGAEQVTLTLQEQLGTSSFWVTFGVVQVLLMFGYALSNLPKWGGWKDGTRVERLELVRGVMASVVAGNGLYYAATAWQSYGQPTGFVGCLVGGFAGDRVIQMAVERVLGAWSALLGSKSIDGGKTGG